MHCYQYISQTTPKIQQLFTVESEQDVPSTKGVVLHWMIEEPYIRLGIATKTLGWA
jgi:hypothetical protein